MSIDSYFVYLLQVIDEIDGALSGAEGKGAIDALLEIVRVESLVSLFVHCKTYNYK